LTKEFGGTTRVKALGSWYDSDADRVVKERVAKVEVFLDAPIWDKQKNRIYEWCRNKQREWGQSVVAFEKDSKMTFLKKEKKRATPLRRRPKKSFLGKLLRGY